MKAETMAYLETHFEKLRQLRHTSKGDVWLTTKADGKLVVWKTIRMTGLPYAAIKRLSHPLLPEVIYVAEDEEQTIVIEEYVQGEPLSELVQQKRFLGEREIRSIMLQLCDGLALLHANGIIHRDIKPSNILRQKNGTVRLIDFDAARTVKEDSEEDTNLLGTRGYAPPEQFGYGQTDARSDIYSLGITLKKLLSPDYNGYLRKILDKCTEVDAKRRYESVQSLERAVRYGSYWQKLRWLALGTVILAIGAVFYLTPRGELPQQENVSHESVRNPEQEHESRPTEMEPEPADSKESVPVQKPELPMPQTIQQDIHAASPTPSAAPNVTEEAPKKAAETEEPATQEQPENRIYMNVFWNGKEIWHGRNVFDIPLNNMGTILHIPKELWQTWGRSNEAGISPVQFPADWELRVQVQNVSDRTWENPQLELMYDDHGIIKRDALYGSTLQAGQEMEFEIPLGGYQVEHPDTESPLRDLRLHLTGDGTQEVFSSTFTVNFDFEQ